MPSYYPLILVVILILSFNNLLPFHQVPKTTEKTAKKYDIEAGVRTAFKPKVPKFV